MVMFAGDAAATPWRPSDLSVAAALSRRPFGLRSARAVARLAGLSPTTAGRALRRLQRAGIVHQRADQVAEGNVREVRVWTIDWRSPTWHAIAGEVGKLSVATVAEESTAGATSTRRVARRIPARLAHLFWNADLATVDPTAHGAYVATRILRSDDCQALGWLARSLAPEHIRLATTGRGLERRRVVLGHLLAGI